MLAAALSLAGLVLQWWLSTRELRVQKKVRRENVRIHNQVASGDVSALRARLRRLRAEGP